MRCIVHVWSEEHGPKPVSLHILPLDSPSGLQSTEVFDSRDALCERLQEIGLSRVQVVLTLSNLRDKRDAIWMNVEIPEPKAVEMGPPRDNPTLAA